LTDSRQHPSPEETAGPRPAAGVPRWLYFVTIALALLILFMAVAETTLWTHWFIDQGEYLSLVGLAFILVVGLRLHRRRQLLASLPLTLPWLVYPMLTQADQIIDNLSINQMRAVCQSILVVLFGIPIAVLLLSARQLLSPSDTRFAKPRWWTGLVPGFRLIEQGRVLEGAYLFALSVLIVEIWIAFELLGRLMVWTLTVASLALLLIAGLHLAGSLRGSLASARIHSHRMALSVFLAGVGVAFGLYLGFKNRPGAYQGSPHYYHDASAADAAFALDRVPAPTQQPSSPSLGAHTLQSACDVLGSYARALEELLDAYYILDRNYNYAFHNALFLRNTPILSGFREKALAQIQQVRLETGAVDARTEILLIDLTEHDALRNLVLEVREYVSFNLRRASILEEMSGRFEATEAGLQHATHLYEGEGKVLGEVLMAIVEKHRTAIEEPAVASRCEGFVSTCQTIHGAYANRIVGF
jgi:hypothetical protein